MTWKSTAAASGAMVVATWLASNAPVGGPRKDAAVAPSAAHTETAAAEIQREADRLHSRLKSVGSYKVPARNPFRFTERPPARVPVHQPVAPRETPPVVVPEPPPIQMMLAGIGEDVVGDEVTRTAIISAPDNVHIVKVGDTIGDAYKVTKIDADAVELARVGDGSTLRLTLR